MRKRNVTITIRCTVDERQQIYNKARQHELTLSDFVLRSALGKKIVTADGLADVLKGQKSIGRNLNQIAVLGNMGRLNASILIGWLSNTNMQHRFCVRLQRRCADADYPFHQQQNTDHRRLEKCPCIRYKDRENQVRGQAACNGSELFRTDCLC